MCDTDTGRQSQARRMEDTGIGTFVHYLGVRIQHNSHFTHGPHGSESSNSLIFCATSVRTFYKEYTPHQKHGVTFPCLSPTVTPLREMTERVYIFSRWMHRFGISIKTCLCYYKGTWNCLYIQTRRADKIQQNFPIFSLGTNISTHTLAIINLLL